MVYGQTCSPVHIDVAVIRLDYPIAVGREQPLWVVISLSEHQSSIGHERTFAHEITLPQSGH